MRTIYSTPSFIRCFQSILTFIFVSICLFLLSLLTYFTLKKHLIPVSHLVIPISLGLPKDFDPKMDIDSSKSSTHFPPYLVSYINLSDTLYNQSPLDISRHPYTIELVCHSPRSYRNRQTGSFFVQIILHSTTDQLIIERSRLILYPYQSEIVRIIRTLIFLPFSIFNIDYDRWYLQQILLERLTNGDQSKSFVEKIQLNIIPPSFELDQCSLHFHICDLTGLVYSFVNYPILTGCLAIFFLFSIYMTFYLIITGLTLLNQMTKTEDCKKKLH
ncbi:hypothetical protein I4U23_029257 [Adineta vaga]|nr:hypothetical protein I4U23_029257 [Adineta vaga]